MAAQQSAAQRAATTAQAAVEKPQNAPIPRTFVDSNQTSITQALTRYEAQIAQALPKSANDLNAQRIIQIAATLIARDPKLKGCDVSSIIAAVMQASILGLNPLPQLAECYFVPYGNQCQFQIGYRGFLNLYYRSRNVREVYAYVVREGDDFSYTYGLDRTLTHKAVADVGATVTHAYAVMKLITGGILFIVLTAREIERLRQRSPMQKGKPATGTWKDDYEAMCYAKVLKQLRRQVPSDGSIDAALASDEAVIRLEHFRTDSTGLDLAAIETAEEVEAKLLEPQASDTPQPADSQLFETSPSIPNAMME